PNNASTAMLYLSQIMQDYLQDEFGAETTVTAAVDTKIQATGAQSQNVTAAMPQGALITDVRMLYNPQLKSAYNFVPGILGMIMILICVLMTSVSIVKEKETGTMEVLLVSPVKPMAIFVAKMLPYFVLSCIILLIVFLLIFFVLQVPVVGSLFWVIVVSLLYVVLSLGIGLMVSTMVRTQLAATTIAGLVFMIPVLMLSGMIYDVEGLPKAFYYIAQIIPAKWYIAAVKKIMIEGMAVRYALKEILVLVGMTVLVFFTAIKNFNDRLE
ncbi:MAG: ABC transporter permease, partial [Bacteroidales bacterium]|nr:ABC transporter permease [Bacteroidales bacterium]